MVRNIVVLGGNSHPQLTENVCQILGVPASNRILGKFSGGESRCEIKDSVRGKDVYIIQSGSGNVNDNLIDLCIMISACKTGSAKRVTAVVPLFPYSRQPDWPYNKAGAPLERRPIRFTEHRNASMMLVGDVSNRICILVDDIVDTGNTITRAAKLLKKEGATQVYALVTHGVFSGDAIARINASAIDKMLVTNSVPQNEHRRLCPKLEVLDISAVFAEAIRRVHHGESISVLFQHN
ncbi:Ribose-phosphate pyrophosphokinase 5 [Fusarium odoratissimum]|uniref:Ribose-phosphate pyrophosphokinase 5 n=2 Tax=Fusarium oxysporum species complex TaxID=171631 RepID=N1S6R0_FUSC4|nr:Ribose-phosphate pyrophosphokinase 5 [Fusarium odoratissimum]ENH72935.1 Ribose-phosphate pyrophosphokinase 5 [Fusarium oxysporum f. sp. cubense race 1]